LRIFSPGATDLNVGFTTFWLPEGATLHLAAENEPYYQGPYTAQDNSPRGQLWTPVIPGNRAVIELFVPAQSTQQPRIVLGQVGTGYRDMFHQQQSLAGSPRTQGCEIDVVCPQAAPWSNEVRSVALYSLSGNFACTGTLLAEAAGDFRNYFLTANHCGITPDNAASVVVYWNFQSPSCGQLGGGSLNQQQHGGAYFRAAKADVDFCLIELASMPDPTNKVYFSGWDRSGLAPAGGVGIHHPGTVSQPGEKAISFSSNVLTTVNSCTGTGGSNTHWQVIWSAGVTEPFSVGSGFWDSDTHLLVGTLSGGSSSCSNPNSPDCYGKFSVAWDSGTAPTNRLRDWLDPQDVGVTTVPGWDPALVSIVRSAGSWLVSESCSPPNQAIDPGETVTVSFALHNVGGVNVTNLVATLLVTNGVTPLSGPQTYGALAAGGASVSNSFTFAANGNCGATISPTLSLQDGPRDLGTVSFSYPLGALVPTPFFSENFDGVTPPALPVGWSSSVTGSVSTAWATTSDQADTPPNSVFAPDPDGVSDNRLTSPVIALPTSNAQLTFRHSYNVESATPTYGYDGGVLEISINGDPFTDILNAGGSFVTGGYTSTINSGSGNPLSGRQGWSGNSAGFVTTTVNLPSAAAGQNIQLRWRFGSDSSTGIVGWYVDSIVLMAPEYSCCGALVTPLIINPRLADSNSFAFSYDSVSGHSYVVETKTDVASTYWLSLQTNSGDGTRQSFTNPVTGRPHRYFRLRAQ
jgi:hypothetical protein